MATPRGNSGLRGHARSSEPRQAVGLHYKMDLKNTNSNAEEEPRHNNDSVGDRPMEAEITNMEDVLRPVITRIEDAEHLALERGFITSYNAPITAEEEMDSCPGPSGSHRENSGSEDSADRVGLPPRSRRKRPAVSYHQPSSGEDGCLVVEKDNSPKAINKKKLRSNKDRERPPRVEGPGASGSTSYLATAKKNLSRLEEQEEELEATADLDATGASSKRPGSDVSVPFPFIREETALREAYDCVESSLCAISYIAKTSRNLKGTAVRSLHDATHNIRSSMEKISRRADSRPPAEAESEIVRLKREIQELRELNKELEKSWTRERHEATVRVLRVASDLRREKEKVIQLEAGIKIAPTIT